MKKVIKFYAEWCGPCKVYAKTFDEISEEFDGQIEFNNINIDKDTSGLAAEYNVRSIPHTVLLKEDGTVKSKTGLLSNLELKELILS